MSTFIHGVGASENIDTSGEIVSIAGLDVSSLEKDGNFTWEHKNDLPSQIVGKILKAKKIFSDADCEDDHQLYFWNKIKTPYLYVMGELFDDYKDSAREVAGMFRYDADRKNQNEHAVMNFSVEGSKISKEGITVTRSIARKITITALPCNKAAVAEMVAVDQKPKNNVDELFKTETVEIEIFTPTPNSSLWNLLKKEDPKKHATKLGIKPFQKDMGGGQASNGASTGLSGVGPTSSGGLLASEMAKSTQVAPLAKDHQRGNKIGITSSGKDVFSHGMVGDYEKFSPQDHQEAAMHHNTVAEKLKGTDAKSAIHHSQKNTLHLQASKSAARRSKTTPSAAHVTKPAAVAPSPVGAGVDKYSFSPNPKKMFKAMDAGSGMSAPGSQVGGAALAAPSSPGSPGTQVITQNTMFIGKKKKRKSDLLIRAELEYTTWTKREEFEAFMKSRMPGLTKSQIQVIGQTMLLQKSNKQEKELSKVASSEFQHSFINKKEKK